MKALLLLSLAAASLARRGDSDKIAEDEARGPRMEFADQSVEKARNADTTQKVMDPTAMPRFLTSNPKTCFLVTSTRDLISMWPYLDSADESETTFTILAPEIEGLRQLVPTNAAIITLNDAPDAEAMANLEKLRTAHLSAHPLLQGLHRIYYHYELAMAHSGLIRSTHLELLRLHTERRCDVFIHSSEHPRAATAALMSGLPSLGVVSRVGGVTSPRDASVFPARAYAPVSIDQTPFLQRVGAYVISYAEWVARLVGGSIVWDGPYDLYAASSTRLSSVAAPGHLLVTPLTSQTVPVGYQPVLVDSARIVDAYHLGAKHLDTPEERVAEAHSVLVTKHLQDKNVMLVAFSPDVVDAKFDHICATLKGAAAAGTTVYWPVEAPAGKAGCGGVNMDTTLGVFEIIHAGVVRTVVTDGDLTVLGTAVNNEIASIVIAYDPVLARHADRVFHADAAIMLLPSAPFLHNQMAAYHTARLNAPHHLHSVEYLAHIANATSNGRKAVENLVELAAGWAQVGVPLERQVAFPLDPVVVIYNSGMVPFVVLICFLIPISPLFIMFVMFFTKCCLNNPNKRAPYPMRPVAQAPPAQPAAAAPAAAGAADQGLRQRKGHKIE